MRSSEFVEAYDADKYAEMTLDVAESILGVLGSQNTARIQTKTKRLSKGALWREREGDPTGA